MKDRSWKYLVPALLAFGSFAGAARAQECVMTDGGGGCSDGGVCIEYDCRPNGGGTSTKQGFCEQSADLCPPGSTQGSPCGSGKVCRATGTMMGTSGPDGGGFSCGATLYYCMNPPPDGGAQGGSDASAGGSKGPPRDGGSQHIGTGGATNSGNGDAAAAGTGGAAATADAGGEDGGKKSGSSDSSGCSITLGKHREANGAWLVALALGGFAWSRRGARRQRVVVR